MKLRFKNLDSIRTIAFLSTFAAHAFYTESDTIKKSGAFQWAISFQEIFSFGVPIFFVLSGFLITYLMLKEQNEKNAFHLFHFYMRRILRIWPVYFLVLVIGFVVFPFVREMLTQSTYVENAHPWMYVFFLSNWDQLNTAQLPFGVGLGPTWSVSIEEQFYLVWPVLILLFRKHKFIFAILLVLISSLLLSHIYNLSAKHTLFCMVYLSSGALAAYCAYFYKEFIVKIIHIHSFFFLGIIALLIFCFYLSSHGFGSIWLSGIIALIISYVILFQCFSENLSFQQLPYFEQLGKYTYGLYLYHVICNFIAYTLYTRILGLEESIVSVIAIVPTFSLLLSVLLSYLSYKYFEGYFLQLKSRFQ